MTLGDPKRDEMADEINTCVGKFSPFYTRNLS